MKSSVYGAKQNIHQGSRTRNSKLNLLFHSCRYQLDCYSSGTQSLEEWERRANQIKIIENVTLPQISTKETKRNEAQIALRRSGFNTNFSAFIKWMYPVQKTQTTTYSKNKAPHHNSTPGTCSLVILLCSNFFLSEVATHYNCIRMVH